MPNPFSRTTRSLNADSFRSSLTGLIIAFLLLTVWSAWFFMARMAIYKTSLSVRMAGADILVSEFQEDARRAVQIKEKKIIAEFSQEDIGSIRPGQPAKLYLKQIPQVGPLSAKVDQVSGTQVALSARLAPGVLLKTQQGETGQVKIEVDTVSPAVLVMRASGLFASL